MFLHLCRYVLFRKPDIFVVLLWLIDEKALANLRASNLQKLPTAVYKIALLLISYITEFTNFFLGEN